MKITFIGEFAWVLLGKAIAFIGSILLLKLLTHSMDINAYAQLTLGLTVFNFLVQILTGALGQGVGLVYIDAVSHKDFPGFKRDSFEIIKKTAALYFILVLFGSLISIVTNNAEILPLIVLLLAYSYLNGLNDISGTLQNLSRNRAIHAIGLSIESIFKLVFVYALITVLKNVSATSVVFAYLAASAIALMYQKSMFYRVGMIVEGTRKPKNYWKDKILSVSKSASFWGIFVWLQQASDKWALLIFQNEASVSEYAILYQIGYVPFLMGMGVALTLLVPLIYAQRENYITNKLIVFVGLLTALGFIVSSRFSAEIVGAIVDENFMIDAALLPYMVLAAGLYLSGDVILQQLMRDGRVKEIMKIKIVAALACLISNAMGAFLYGTSGVVGSMVLFGGLYLTMFINSTICRNKDETLHVL